MQADWNQKKKLIWIVNKYGEHCCAHNTKQNGITYGHTTAHNICGHIMHTWDIKIVWKDAGKDIIFFIVNIFFFIEASSIKIIMHCATHFLDPLIFFYCNSPNFTIYRVDIWQAFFFRGNFFLFLWTEN